MRLNSFLYIYVVVLSFLITNSAWCESDYLTDVKKQRVLHIQENIYLDDFQSAFVDADSLILLYPDDPIGYLFKASVMLGEMVDSEEELTPAFFKHLIDTTIILSEQKIQSLDSNRQAWMYLWIGHARAYRSLYESRFGSFTQALKNGFKAKSAYENGLKSDSSLFDLYGGLGMYHYWKSAKAGFLRWIHVFKNDKQKGIDELYLTIDSSLISADAAKCALVWIYIDKNEYKTAIDLSDELLEKYKNGRTFLWAQGKVYYKDESYHKSIKIYQRIKNQLMQNGNNYYNIIETDFRMYESYKKLGLEQEASESAKQIYEYLNKIPESTKKRQKGKINSLVKAANKQ